ncbi:MAG: hypothetical protein V8Q27_01645 [Eubacteriales bacterium]
MGADDYISKPFGIRELLARLKPCFAEAPWKKSSRKNRRIRLQRETDVNNTSREVYMEGKAASLSRKGI